MGDQRLEARKLLGVKTQSAEGTFETDALLAAQCRCVIENARFTFEQGTNVPNPQRPFLGLPPATPGARMGRLTFEILARGSGIAGNAPPEDPLLIATGRDKTTKSGVASVGTPYANPHGWDGVTTGLPAITGTFTGSRSGIYKITMLTSNSVMIEFEAFTGGRQDAYWRSANITISGTPAAFGDGYGLSIATGSLSVDEGNGESWFVNVVSADEVAVEYVDSDVRTNSVSLAFFQDGVVEKMHSCRGALRYVAKSGGFARYFMDFMGCLLDSGETADLAFPGSVAFPNVIPPSVLAEYLTLNAVTPPCWSDFEIDWKRKVEMLSCGGEVTGYEAARITGYTGPISGKFNPLAQIVGTNNPYAGLITGAVGNGLVYRHGSVSGNIIEIESQLNQTVDVKETSSEGNLRHLIEFTMPSPWYSSGGTYGPTIIRYK